LDGANPLYLHGYGAYGISCSSDDLTKVKTLVDKGFVYAIAHIRGGDELGYDWWYNGRGLNQKNKYEDFIACAEYLVKERYTTKGNIFASGSSAGGRLVTTVANMKPDLFRAIIPSNPSLDLLNEMLCSKNKNTCHVYEYGNMNEKEHFENMLSYCPYMNIKNGPYPSVYMINGVNDSRVNYYEPLKFIAKLREHKTNDSIVLLRIIKLRGHFYLSDKFEKIREIAEELAFIFKELGINVMDKYSKAKHVKQKY
jgi:oligopeptidase B